MNPRPIIESVAILYGRTVDELIGPARHARLIDARHLAMVLVRVRLGWSYEHIAHAFGNRDHTTVMHAIHQFPTRMRNDPHLADVVDRFFPEATRATSAAVLFSTRQISQIRKMIREEMGMTANA